MPRRPDIAPPLTADQRLQARETLQRWADLLSYVRHLDELENLINASAREASPEIAHAYEDEMGLTRQRREEILAQVLNLSRALGGRRGAAEVLRDVACDALIEDAVDMIQRLRTPWREDPRAHAMREHDRLELPRTIQALQVLEGRAMQTLTSIKARLRQDMKNPPVRPDLDRYKGKLTQAAAILAPHTSKKASTIEKNVRARRKSRTAGGTD